MCSNKQKLAGVMRYLAVLMQGSEQDFNKIVMRLYVHLVRSCQYGCAEVLSVLLTVYAQDPTHYRPKYAMQTLLTPKKAENLLAYLGMNVKRSTTNYSVCFWK